MNAGRDVERLIADWFAQDAVLRAPDRVLERTSRAIDRTNRTKGRRLGTAWRALRMSPPLRLAAATIFGVLVVGGALLALRPNLVSVATSPAPLLSPIPLPTPSASASPSVSPSAASPTLSDGSVIPAMAERTTLGLDGVSVGYPTGWVEDDNRVRWWLNGVPDSSELVGFSVDSSNLDPSETEADWVADRAAREAEAYEGFVTCPASAGPTEITIAGSRGFLVSSDCSITSGERHHFLAVLVADGRGYSFHMDIGLKQNRRAWFDALLGTVQLEPAASEDP